MDRVKFPFSFYYDFFFIFEHKVNNHGKVKSSTLKKTKILKSFFFSFLLCFSDRKEFEDEGLALPNNSTNAQRKFTRDRETKTTYLSDNHANINRGSFSFLFLFFFKGINFHYKSSGMHLKLII